MADVAAELKTIDERLAKVESVEERLIAIEKKEEADLEKIEEEEKLIEKNLLSIGSFSLKRSHVLELARGAAGAFLGVGLGQALGSSVSLAQHLPWLNIFGILFFIILLTALLIYKNDKDLIKSHHQLRYISGKVTYLYVISLAVQLLGLVLFNNFPGFGETLWKALIIGSYTAMSSAVAFTLI
ncbi:MAG: hypothetical protein JO026_03820 [Patescibacteria group bacterium]|nr:hypothetical protein [Patescibacteria group bacterium]